MPPPLLQPVPMPPSAPAPLSATPPLSATDLLRRLLFSPRGRVFWAVFLVLTAIYALNQALTPHPKGPSFGWDKLNHALAFAVLAFAGLFTLRERAHPVFWTVFLLLALGLGIELAQMYVPGRSAEWNDVAADTVGVGLGLLVALNVARRLDRRRRRRSPGESRPGPSSLPTQQP